MLTLAESIAEEKKLYRAADKALNTQYKKLYAILDGAGRDKLMRAQRAWIAYRDANAMLRGHYSRGKTSASAATVEESELRLYTALREMTEARVTEIVAIGMEMQAATKR